MVTDLNTNSHPKVLGRYVLKGKLERAGIGDTYESTHPRLNLPVIVKVLSQELLNQSKQNIEQFIKEGRNLARLNHPAIQRIYDANCERDYHYIVMEAISGQSLESLCSNNKCLQAHEVLDIAIALCEALKEGNYHNVIHGAICPANIYKTHRDTYKLLHFGITRLPDDPTGKAFRPPHKVHNIHSDIFALGASLFKFCCGDLYNVPQNNPGREPYAILKLKKPNLPSNLCDIICKMMQTDEMNRYTNYDAILNDLHVIKYRTESTKKSNISKQGKEPRSLKQKNHSTENKRLSLKNVKLKPHQRLLVFSMWLAGPVLCYYGYHYLIDKKGRQQLIEWLQHDSSQSDDSHKEPKGIILKER